MVYPNVCMYKCMYVHTETVLFTDEMKLSKCVGPFGKRGIRKYSVIIINLVTLIF